MHGTQSPPPEWLALGFFGLVSASVSVLVEAVRDEPAELGKALLRSVLSALLSVGILALTMAVHVVDLYVGVGISVFIGVIGVQASERVLRGLVRGPWKDGEHHDE